MTSSVSEITQYYIELELIYLDLMTRIIVFMIELNLTK